jgi:hypothetical protein
MLPFLYTQIGCPCASPQGGTRTHTDPSWTPYNSSMKNKHLEHAEDTILTGDLSVLNWFVTPGKMSVKIDGAPAVVWGIDPACGEFFVGTKAVFNKKKIRIAHNHEEIDSFYQGEVARILHACFDYLPRANGIIQGDFIGFGGSDEYTPNTITYKFPEVVSQEIIVAPHTVYNAENDLRDAVASPMNFIITDTPYCKFVQPEAYIQHGQTSFEDVEEVCNFARQMAQTVEFVTDKEAAQIKQQINACIRENREVEDDAFGCDVNLIRLWKLVKSIKADCLYLCRNSGPAAYIGQDRIDAEGYVLTNEFGMFKLVNREVFAYANFNSGRFNCATC